MVVLVLFAALIGPYFINWTSYRQDFEREASRILGQKVEVLGTAQARLLPFPSVTFNNVRVVNAKTGAPMMSIARFSMDAELAPFLRGQILIFDMRLDQPNVTVRLMKDGQLDWALRNANALGSTSVVLEKVEVRKGSLDFVDEQNARTQHVRSINAALSAQALTGPWSIEGTAALDGKTGAFSIGTGQVKPDGSLRVRTRLLPDREPVSVEMEGDARFEDNQPRYAGTFTLQILDLAAISGQPRAASAGGGDQPAIARATGNFALDNTRLQIDQYRLEVGSTTDPYVATGEASVDTGKSPHFLLVANGQQIDLDSLDGADGGDAAGPVDAKKPKPRRLTPSERVALLRRIGSLIPIPPMKGRASVKLPAIVAGDTTISDIAIEAEPAGQGWTIDSFAAQFPGRTRVEAKGRLTLGDAFGFTGDMLVASNQPSGLSEWLKGSVDPRIRLLQAAGFSAKVSLSDARQRFDDLELAIGPATAHGRFERSSPATGRGKVAVDLDGETIDFDMVRALAGIFIDEKSVVSLADEDVSARLKAQRLTAFGAEADGVDADLAYSDGSIDVRTLKVADLAGARLSLSGKVSSARTAPAGSLSGSVDAASAAGVFDLVRTIAGPGPVIDVLDANAGLFSGTHLDVKASFGGGSGRALDATITGKTGGSDLTLQVKRPDALAPLASAPVTAELTGQNPSVNRLFGQMGLQPLPLDAPGPALLSARFSGTPSEGGEVGFDLSSQDSDLSANGKLALSETGKPTGQLDLALTSKDLSPYLIMNGIALPEAPSGLPADLRAQATLGADTIKLAGLSGGFGADTLSGELTLAGGARPVVSGQLALDALDADWLARAVLGPGIVDADGGWSSDDFAPAQDFGIDADIAVTARAATLGVGAPVRALSGHLTLSGGQVALDSVTGLWLGGTLEGALRIGNTNGSGLLAGQIALKSADLASALAPTDLRAQGRFDFSASFQGTGKSALALVNGLSGSGAFSSPDLTLAGFNADGFSSILAAADRDGFKIATAPVLKVARVATAGGMFHAGAVSQPFSVAGGTLSAQNITLSNPKGDLSGDLSVDLAHRTASASFTLAYKAGDDAVAGATPAVAWTLGGPLAKPRHTLSAGDLGTYLSLRAYEIERRRVELLQASVLEKQRLRREIDLLDAEAAERRQQAAIDLEEKRRRAAAQAVLNAERAAEAEARQKAQEAEEAARRKAEADARAKAGQQAPAPPSSTGGAAGNGGAQPESFDVAPFNAAPGARPPASAPASPPPAQPAEPGANDNRPGSAKPTDAPPATALPGVDFNRIPGATGSGFGR